LSDIKVTSSKKKQTLQSPQKSAIPKNEGKNSLMSEINAVENVLYGDTDDLSWIQPDDLGAYELIGLYSASSSYSFISTSYGLMDDEAPVSSFLSQSSLFCRLSPLFLMSSRTILFLVFFL
jgi:hypothetical protein